MAPDPSPSSVSGRFHPSRRALCAPTTYFPHRPQFSIIQFETGPLVASSSALRLPPSDPRPPTSDFRPLTPTSDLRPLASATQNLMNAFNRFITILLLLLLLVLIVALAARPDETISWMQVQLGNGSAALIRYRALDPTNFMLARVAAVLIAVLVIIPLLLAEVRRKGTEAVRVRTEAGDALVTTDSIARRLAWHLDQLADVITAMPEVRARGDHVDITIDVETSPVVDVPMKTEEIMLLTREVVEQDMGIKVGRLNVRVRHSDYPEVA